MLLHLSLHNFVIVEHIELDFFAGFTALTGETGAGKSITLDALNLLLGDKASPAQVRVGEKEAQLSALFDISGLPSLRKNLVEQGLADENDEELTLRRIISAEGKSRNFINGQLATLAQMKKIGESLIDIHGQNAHQSLNSEATQRNILDAFSGCMKEAQDVKDKFGLWKNAEQVLEEAQNQADKIAFEREFLQRQYDEISALSPQADEWENLSQSYDRLAHAAELSTAAQTVLTMIDDDKGLQVSVSRAMRELEHLTHLADNFNESVDLFASIETELSEIAAMMRAVVNQAEIDPQELARQDERMRDLSSAAKKFHVDENRLPEKLTEIGERLQELEEAADLSLLAQKVKEAEQEYQRSATELSRLRKVGAKKLSAEVSHIMHELAMEGAVFQVALNAGEASAHGNERVQYQIAVNRGGVLQALNKVASGGELARISLAIQVAAAKYTDVPTLIFDEVDSGIGGRVAEIVGRRLAALGENYQILVITHLAQVASCAQNHWQVMKHDENGKTVSEIRILDENMRVQEIARMIGGTNITEATIAHAQEMLKK